ncbi:MAG: CoA transferase [Dehalococcoidia bacterium]|nr:CoA transferase [Dehalococcoidia bacterium]
MFRASRPARARLGLSCEEVSKDRPELVMFSTCLRGQTGPQRSLRRLRRPGAPPSPASTASPAGRTASPRPLGPYTDSSRPATASLPSPPPSATRNLTGEGQHIDLARVEAAIHFIEPAVLDYRERSPRSSRRPRIALRQPPRRLSLPRRRALRRHRCETAQQWQNLPLPSPRSPPSPMPGSTSSKRASPTTVRSTPPSKPGAPASTATT